MFAGVEQLQRKNTPLLPLSLQLILEEVIGASEFVGDRFVYVQGPGYAVAYYNDDGSPKDEYRIHLSGVGGHADTTEWKALGHIVHELTHVAVDRAYRQDFVNFPLAGSPADLPGREVGAGGTCSNEELRQLKWMNAGGAQLEESVQRLKSMSQLASVSTALSQDQRTAVTGQLQYGMGKPHIEQDTVINQVLYWLVDWGVGAPDPFYLQLETRVVEAHNFRKNPKARRLAGP